LHDAGLIDTPVQEPVVKEQHRCIIVVNDTLPAGKASNAAAVVALTIGQRHPHLVGAPLVSSDGQVHAGLIPIGIPILKATSDQLAVLRQKSLEQCDVVDFPVQGQATTDYSAFLAAVNAVRDDALQYLAIGLVGTKKKVGKLVSGLALYA
jgi:hypothetical protein